MEGPKKGAGNVHETALHSSQREREKIKRHMQKVRRRGLGLREKKYRRVR